MKNYREA